MTNNITVDNRIAFDIDCSIIPPKNLTGLRSARGQISGAEMLRPH